MKASDIFITPAPIENLYTAGFLTSVLFIVEVG